MPFIKNLLCAGLNIICIQSGGKAKTRERPMVLGPRVKAEVDILKGPDTAFDKIQHPFIPSNKILGN